MHSISSLSLCAIYQGSCVACLFDFLFWECSGIGILPGVRALWEGEGAEGRANQILLREGGDLSLGQIEEVRGHQGKRACC